MRKVFLLIAVAIVFIFVACGNENTVNPDNDVADENIINNDDDNVLKPFTIKGAVAKGPLVKGSAIYFTILSETGEQEGLILNATTDDDMGRFSYKVTAAVAPNVIDKVCKISATGYFYDEIGNRLSNSPTTLEALFRITDTEVQDARINLLTHMTVKRTLQLMDGGTVFETAQAQAETELIAEMGVFYAPASEDPRKPAIQMDITTDPYPLAIACIFNQAAFNIAKDDAEFYGKYQQLLNDTSADLVDGTLTAETKDIIIAGEANLDATACMENLKNYLEEKTGETQTLPDPNESVDTNNNGIPNASDPDIDGDGVENELDCVNGVTDYKSVFVAKSVACATKNDNIWKCFTLSYEEAFGWNNETWKNNFSKIISGTVHFCGMDNENFLWCWGHFTPDFQNYKETPIKISTTTWKNVFAGQNRTCGIDNLDQLYCWQNDLTTDPIKINDDTDWLSLSLGNDKFYGIKNDKTLWNWNFGEIPTQVGVEHWKYISNTSLYGILENGTLWYISDLILPIQIGSDTDWQSVYGTCAIKTDNTLWCWSDSDKNPATQINNPEWSCGEWNLISHYKDTDELYCGIKSDSSLWCWKNGVMTYIDKLPVE